MLFLRKNNDVNLFNEMNSIFDEFVKPRAGFMKTDIQETESAYMVEVDVPGIKKEDIKISVEDGYLNVSVERKEETIETEKYIRRERVVQSGSRSFYVGDVNENDVKAKFDNGVLTINIPKKESKPEIKKIIEIE